MLHIVDDAIAFAFTTSRIRVAHPDFIDGVSNTLDRITGSLTRFQLCNDRLDVCVDAVVFTA